jgi:hypothetical protein
MPPQDSLGDFLRDLPIEKLSQRAHMLLVGYFLRLAGETQFSATSLQDAFDIGGLPAPDHLGTRLGQLASGKNAALIRLGKGTYSLSLHGVREVEKYIKIQPTAPTAVQRLQALAGKLDDTAEQRFLGEAVTCLQYNLKRAAIVMTWELTLDHVYRFVLKHKLADFNAAVAKRSDAGKLPVVAALDDFADMKESVVIEVLRSAKIISNDVRKILDDKLGTRNSAGHPSDIEFSEAKVTDFVEDLVDNVILKYAL